jgi:hypothetical protein
MPCRSTLNEEVTRKQRECTRKYSIHYNDTKGIVCGVAIVGDVQCNNTIMPPASVTSVRSMHRMTVCGAEQGRIECRKEETGCLI